jgi:hypothetical protein
VDPQTNAKELDQKLFTGGPTDTPIQAPVTETAAAAPAEEKKPVYQGFGGKTIESSEELADYTAQLERQNLEYRLEKEKKPEPTVPVRQFQASAPSQEQTETSPEDLLFSDPGKALKLVKEQAKQEIRAEENAKAQERKFWDDFYKDAPDLQRAEVVVKSVMNENWGEISTLPISQARKILAEKSRMIVKGIKGDNATVTELPSAPANTFGASGGKVPPRPAPQRTGTFIDQVRKLQRRS